MNEPDKLGEVDRILSGRANGAAPSPPPSGGVADDESGLPEPNDPYLAHARTANKPVYTLHCLRGAEGIVSFQFVQLDSHSTFQPAKEGQVITLKFAGAKIWQVMIVGTNLRKLYDGIHRHVIPWIRQSDRGFAAGEKNDPLIIDIDIKDVTPKDPA